MTLCNEPNQIQNQALRKSVAPALDLSESVSVRMWVSIGKRWIEDKVGWVRVGINVGRIGC